MFIELNSLCFFKSCRSIQYLVQVGLWLKICQQLRSRVKWGLPEFLL